MTTIQNIEIDAATQAAYLLKGNATIYNSILKSIDTNTEIPPPLGKGIIMDFICKIFSDPQYVIEKNKIRDIILNVDPQKGKTIIKLIHLISIFRPQGENEIKIDSKYTYLSKEFSQIPNGEEYLDNLLNRLENIQQKLLQIKDKININEILAMIKNYLSKKGGFKRKKQKSKNKSKKKSKNEKLKKSRKK